MRWVTNKDQSDHMAQMQRYNKSRSANNLSENWASKLLHAQSPLKWTRQALWGCRVFDFWNALKGCAIEIDGPEHIAESDAARDEYNYLRSGIKVFRVPNFDEAAMLAAIASIEELEPWAARRQAMGLTRNSKKARRELLEANGVALAHGDWIPGR